MIISVLFCLFLCFNNSSLCRSYLRGCLPGVDIDSKALGNFKILVGNRIKFPDKIPRPRSLPHEIDTALEDWFNDQLAEALKKGSYAFVLMLKSFKEIDPGFRFKASISPLSSISTC